MRAPPAERIIPLTTAQCSAPTALGSTGGHLGGTDGRDQEGELAAITVAVQAYETVRWPKGRVEGGKG
jgi:hypothetical protein